MGPCILISLFGWVTIMHQIYAISDILQYLHHMEVGGIRRGNNCYTRSEVGICFLITAARCNRLVFFSYLICD